MYFVWASNIFGKYLPFLFIASGAPLPGLKSNQEEISPGYSAYKSQTNTSSKHLPLPLLRHPAFTSAKKKPTLLQKLLLLKQYLNNIYYFAIEVRVRLVV
ncbi:hypothetical protein [Rufibacter quisquiliarum]|uniref:Uncharacterized protein n=1 Tax=Rufibacter quisquiliarum TaxID=1549639 RepID=A0A839GHM7_9BACT|nr:hypothetical protein [Rufibacter quisquiliarum]MBA9078110.1 hypothetical protein [Rufibacter quisquiliarum]